MFWGYSIEDKETDMFRIETKKKVESSAMRTRVQMQVIQMKELSKRWNRLFFSITIYIYLSVWFSRCPKYELSINQSFQNQIFSQNL